MIFVIFIVGLCFWVDICGFCVIVFFFFGYIMFWIIFEGGVLWVCVILEIFVDFFYFGYKMFWVMFWGEVLWVCEIKDVVCLLRLGYKMFWVMLVGGILWVVVWFFFNNVMFFRSVCIEELEGCCYVDFELCWMICVMLRLLLFLCESDIWEFEGWLCVGRWGVCWVGVFRVVGYKRLLIEELFGCLCFVELVLVLFFFWLVLLYRSCCVEEFDGCFCDDGV